MDQLLRPERLDTDLNSSSAAQEWTHWFRTFQNFLAVLPDESLEKIGVLTNFVSPRIYEAIADCTNYEVAIQILKDLYIKPLNEVFARYCGDIGSPQHPIIQLLYPYSKARS